MTLMEQSVGAVSPPGEPLTAPSQGPRPGDPAPETERDTPGAPLGDAPATGKPRGNRGGVRKDSPLTIAFRLRLEPGAAEAAALSDLWGLYCRAVRHCYRRVKHYTDLYPRLRKKEQHPGTCAGCGREGVQIVCLGPKGPLCAECHAPFTDVGLWKMLYPREREATLTRLSRKKGQEGVRITRHYPVRLPKAADNITLAAPGLSGTLCGEAFQAGVALAKMRRQQAALFRRRADAADQRAADLEGTILALPPCDDAACREWRRAMWLARKGKGRRPAKRRMCAAQIHKAIAAKRRAEKEARRWALAWQGSLTTPRDLAGISLRFRGPTFEAGRVTIHTIRRGWTSSFDLPAAARAKPAAWVGDRLALATKQAGERVVYASVYRRGAEWWLAVPLRFEAPTLVARGYLGVWPTASHVSLSALTSDAWTHIWSGCVPWGLSGSELRRARAGWARHRARASKALLDGRRYRLNRKLRTTHTHTRRTVATDTHRLAKRIVALAAARGLGLALPSPRAFASIAPLPVSLLLGRIAYKARMEGVPVRGPEGMRDGLYVPLYCPECHREGLEGGLQTECPCGLSLDRGIARARLASQIASGWVAPGRAGALDTPPASDSSPGNGPGEVE